MGIRPSVVCSSQPREGFAGRALAARGSEPRRGIAPQPTLSTTYRSDGSSWPGESWESCLTPCAGLQKKPALLFSPSLHPGQDRGSRAEQNGTTS